MDMGIPIAKSITLNLGNAWVEPLPELVVMLSEIPTGTISLAVRFSCVPLPQRLI